MTQHLTTAVVGHARTVPPEARHRHDTTCYWDVDDCRWECGTYPAVRYALERCTATGRPLDHSDTRTRP